MSLGKEILISSLTLYSQTAIKSDEPPVGRLGSSEAQSYSGENRPLSSTVCSACRGTGRRGTLWMQLEYAFEDSQFCKENQSILQDKSLVQPKEPPVTHLSLTSEPNLDCVLLSKTDQLELIFTPI